MIANNLLIFLFLLDSFTSKVSGAKIEGVRLQGDSDSFIRLSSHSRYTLNCLFRAAYNDPVIAVNWFRDGTLVYAYETNAHQAIAYPPLSGKVMTTKEQSLEHLHFTGDYSRDLTGNYSCQVFSSKGSTSSKLFPLVVLDISSNEFVSNVTLKSETLSPNETLEEESMTTNWENGPTNWEGRGANWEERATNWENRGANCTLLWDFETPAIFPKPNVTCGYYSYLHDDITKQIPAGLTLHLLQNGSWTAGFKHIPIQVSDIPREERLGCSVRIPNTDYKKVVKFEDNFAIDYLIDSSGCPSMFLDPSNGLEVALEGGRPNCRGDLVPDSDQELLAIKISCPESAVAVFPNGTAVAGGWMQQLRCDPLDFSWKIVEGGSLVSTVADIRNSVPMCVLNSASSAFVSLIFIIPANFLIIFVKSLY